MMFTLPDIVLVHCFVNSSTAKGRAKGHIFPDHRSLRTA